MVYKSCIRPSADAGDLSPWVLNKMENEAMKDFPLPLHRVRDGKIVLDEAQREWLRETFPVTENAAVCMAMGVSRPTLYRLVKEMGLRRSSDGLREIKRRQGRRHHRMVIAERMRMMGGGRPERCGNIRIVPFTSVQVMCRHNAKRNHGYLVADGYGMGDGHPDRWVIFYDEGTRRSERFEANCREKGFVFKPLAGVAAN